MNRAAAWRQFCILYRDGLVRMVDPEILAERGDITVLVAQILGLLAAAGLVVADLMVPRYFTSSLPRVRLLVLAWSDEEFLLAATMTVAGLFAVLTWNSLFPDRRDSYILGQLPVRLSTQMMAKLAALGTALAAVAGAFNLLAGITLPLATAPRPGFGSAVLSFAAWWVTVGGAAAFALCSAMALQGWASQLLPWRIFREVSGILQMICLLAVLVLFFLGPPFTVASGLSLVPSHWFVGLLHGLNGDPNPFFQPLRSRALAGLLAAVSLALTASALAWFRNMRRMVEAPELAPSQRWNPGNLLARLLAARPLDRAILQFSVRTLSRSSRHRLLLAAYLGVGLGTAMVFSRNFLTAGWRGADSSRVSLLSTGLLIIVFSIVSVRATFDIPVALPANWVFRVASEQTPEAFFRSVRRMLYRIAAVPAWLGTAAFYWSVWPGRPAALHLLFLAVVAIWLVERSLSQFRKIPYTCSWLPGGLHSRLKAAILTVVLLMVAEAISGIEAWAMGSATRFVLLMSTLGVIAWRARHVNTEAFTLAWYELQFEESTPVDIEALNLGGCG